MSKLITVVIIVLFFAVVAWRMWLDSRGSKKPLKGGNGNHGKKGIREEKKEEEATAQ